MTPEEKAVIQAAIKWANTYSVGELEDASEALQDAVAELTQPHPRSAFVDLAAAVDALDGTETMVSEWTAATWADVIRDDEVRLPGRPETQAQADTISPPLDFHVKDGGTGKSYHDKPLNHTVRRVRLSGRADVLEFDPAAPVEILMDAPRRGMHLLGGEVVDSFENRR